MSEPEKYLAPAVRVIAKLAPGGGGADDRLHRGIEAAVKATGVKYSGVFRWMRPKAVGGRDGLIPSKHHPRLLDYAREHKLPLTPDDFFA